MIYVAGYFLIGFLLSSIVAVLQGRHYKEHGGQWKLGCDLWACVVPPFVPLVGFLLIWPLMLVISVLYAWYEHLQTLPYLRSLPPENEHPTAKIKSDDRK